MAWGLSVADGYDGGVLPLRAYADFRDILIPGTGENPDVLTQHVLSGMPSDRVLDGLGVTSVIRNHEATLKLDTAILDLGSSRRVHTTETWDGLNVMNVVGVAIVIDAPQGEPPGNVGAVELHFLDGESVVLPLWRSSERPERIALGPGHVVSEREGLARPSFYSEVGLLSRHDVATVMVSAESGSFDLRALALIHHDGRTTSLQLRQGVDAVSWAVGEVLLTRRVSGASRAWLTTDVSLAENPDEARAFVRRESFDPLKSTVLTIAPETVHGAASLFDAARALGVVHPHAPCRAQAPPRHQASEAAGREACPQEGPRGRRRFLRRYEDRVLRLSDSGWPVRQVTQAVIAALRLRAYLRLTSGQPTFGGM